MKVKQVLGILLSAVLLASAFAGCGSGASSTASSGSTASTASAGEAAAPSTDTSATLNFYLWNQDQLAGQEAMFALFNEQYPNVEIVPTVLPFAQYQMKLITSLPSGTGPDFFWSNNSMLAATKDLVTDITDLVARDGVDLTPFPQGAIDLFTIDGRLYGIPKDFDTIAMFYNKAIFDEKGVAYPEADWTWDEFREIAKQVTVDDGWGYCCSIGAAQGGWGNFVRQQGVNAVCGDPNTVYTNGPEHVAAMEFLRELVYTDGSTTSAADIAETDARNIFISEKAAMCSDGSWQTEAFYKALGDKLGIAPLPTGKVQGCQTNSLAFVMSAFTKNPEITWELLKFAATKEGQEATAGSVIPAYEGAAGKWQAIFPETLDTQVFLDAIEYATPEYAFVKNDTEIKQIQLDAISNILMDPNLDIQATLDQAQADMEALLNG